MNDISGWFKVHLYKMSGKMHLKAKYSETHNSWLETISVVVDTRHTSALVFQCQVAGSVLSDKNVIKNPGKSHHKKWMESTQMGFMWSHQSYQYQMMTTHLFYGYHRIITGFISSPSFEYLQSFPSYADHNDSYMWTEALDLKSNPQGESNSASKLYWSRPFFSPIILLIFLASYLLA